MFHVYNCYTNFSHVWHGVIRNSCWWTVCFPYNTLHKKWTPSLLSRKASWQEARLCNPTGWRIQHSLPMRNVRYNWWKSLEGKTYSTHPHGSWLNTQFHNSKFTAGIIRLSSVHFPPLQRALSTVVMSHHIHTRDKTMYPKLHTRAM